MFILILTIISSCKSTYKNENKCNTYSYFEVIPDCYFDSFKKHENFEVICIYYLKTDPVYSISIGRIFKNNDTLNVVYNSNCYIKIDNKYKDSVKKILEIIKSYKGFKGYSDRDNNILVLNKAKDSIYKNNYFLNNKNFELNIKIDEFLKSVKVNSSYLYWSE